MIANDEARIIAVTAFPFRTRPVEGNPKTRRDRKWFVQHLRKLLDDDCGYGSGPTLTEKYQPYPMRRYIQDMVLVPNPTSPGKDPVVRTDWASVGNFEFQRVRGKWLFALADWDD